MDDLWWLYRSFMDDFQLPCIAMFEGGHPRLRTWFASEILSFSPHVHTKTWNQSSYYIEHRHSTGLTNTGWWFQPSWTVLVNGKDYPIYYGNIKMSQTTNQIVTHFSISSNFSGVTTESCFFFMKAFFSLSPISYIIIHYPSKPI